MLRSSIITVAIAAALGLAACGDDDSDATQTSPAAAAAGDVDRYCALTRRLDAEGEKFFANLGQDATPKQYEAAERRFIETHSSDLDELGRAAPREIRADVQTLFAGMRQRAGLKPAAPVSEKQASDAETRIRAFERRSCSG